MKKQTKANYETPAIMELALQLGGDMLIVSIPDYHKDEEGEFDDDEN